MIKIRFDQFVKLQRGFDLPEREIVSGPYPVVTSTSINGYHDTCKVSPPVVVTGRSGSLGVVQYINEECWPLNTTLYVKDFKGNYPKYVYYFLKTLHLERFNAGAGVPTLNQNHLHGLKIYVHDLEQQRVIGDLLYNYDTIIENNLARISLLEKMASELYKEWFVRFRFPGHEAAKFVDGVPEGWIKCRFSQVVDVMSGGTPSTSVGEYYNGDIPFFTPKDCTDSFFAFETLTNITKSGLEHCHSPLYPENTIIISARGTVGKTTILAVPMSMNQSCYALKFKELNGAHNFLFFSLNNEIRKLQCMASGGVFDTIIVKTFDHIHILMPPEQIIYEFENIIQSIMGLIKQLSLENINLTKQRDLLLPRLMSGKLSVEPLLADTA